MDNNADFISSIKNEGDFEELVRRFCQKVFSSHAYNVGGPNDGGRDLEITVRGRKVKTAFQISIQQTQIEKKINEDLIKTTKLIDDYGYSSVMYFFWSHNFSAGKEENLIKDALNIHGITLEIYDAKKISQKITNEYPDILHFLIHDIHKYVPVADSGFDIKERALYEYLAMSKDTANLKNVIFESQIAAHLYTNDMSMNELIEYAVSLGVTIGKAKAIISGLIQVNRIEISDDKAKLSKVELDRIRTIEARNVIWKDELLESIQSVVDRYCNVQLSEEIFVQLKDTYANSIDMQISEINFEPPKVHLVKQSAAKIVAVLKERGGLSDVDTAAATHELLSVTEKNEYLSKYCSSRLCIGLLHQKKLERYVESKEFFIYLDAPILIYYILILRYSKIDLRNSAFNAIKLFRENIGALKRKSISVCEGHFEETVRHLEQARKLSTFASEEVIASFGESKNIFFNFYLQFKRDKKNDYTFEDFLKDFIGFEEVSGAAIFNSLLFCAQKFLSLYSVEIVRNSNILSDHVVSNIKRRYQFNIQKQRKDQTVQNDIEACQILSDDTRHVDKRGQGQIPLFVTWDTTQHELRNVYRQYVNNHAEWLVYSPQRAVERLSMLSLKLDSTVLKDGVLAIIDEDFFNDSRNSLLDTLGVFLGGDKVESGSVISLLTYLTSRVIEEQQDLSHSGHGEYNALIQILNYTMNEFRTEISVVRKIFADENFKSQVLDLLKSVAISTFDERQKNVYALGVRELIQQWNNI